jgi:4-amino-4-deoxy-L-arabinose transferase-like glycosyltransferase
MTYARIISIFIGSLSIVPLAYIGKKLLERKGLALLLVLFTFSPPLIKSSASAYTESLFILFFLLALYRIIRAQDKIRYIFRASILGALSYYVRPNGIAVLGVVFLSYLFMKNRIPGARFRYLIYIVAVFFICSAPFLHQRYSDFGSPFFYGENSKFFVENSKQTWSGNIEAPSLMEYLRTHSLGDYYNKFITNGLQNVISTYYHTLTPLLFIFFLYNVLKFFRDKMFLSMFLSLMIVFVVWILTLSVVGESQTAMYRHLYPTIPAMLIFASSGACSFFDKMKYGNILTLVLIFFVIFVSLADTIGYESIYRKARLRDGLRWGAWAAKNIKGKIAIVEGGDLIMMHLPDTKISGAGQLDLYAPESKLSVMRPGDFRDLESEMKWFKEKGVTHLAIDVHASRWADYYKKIYSEGKAPFYLDEIYSNHDTRSQWKIKFYLINWVEFEKVVSASES